MAEHTTKYIDGFVLPVPRGQLDTYRQVVEKVAAIWIEHGALAYGEYVADDPKLEGTRSFAEASAANDDETVIFGWVAFESREARVLANERVAEDPRMADLVRPLTDAIRPVYDAGRMIYGGFKPLVQKSFVPDAL